MDIQGLYDSLLDASFGGVTFDVIDSRDEIGRRIERILFPGQARSAFQDLGQLDGDIQINGVLIGDDYVYQAEKLRTAFTTRGPQTLVHPWLGELLVLPTKQVEISFHHDELRVARFTATFWRYEVREPPTLDTLQALLDQLDALRVAARAMLAQVLAPAVTGLSAIGLVERFAINVATVWTSAAGGSDILTAAVVGSVDELTNVAALIPNSDYSDAVCTVFAEPSTAIAAASVSVPPAAVAPGGSTTAAAVVDPRMSVAAILTATSAMPGLAGTTAPGPGVSAVCQMLAIADAIGAATDIVFTSQQEAEATRDQLLGVLSATSDVVAGIAASAPIEAGPAWQAIQAVRAAFVADISTVIGRLPAVTTITPPAPAPLWIIAQYLAGDTPDQILSTYTDLVTRNSIVHPAIVPTAPLETLQ